MSDLSRRRAGQPRIPSGDGFPQPVPAGDEQLQVLAHIQLLSSSCEASARLPLYQELELVFPSANVKRPLFMPSSAFSVGKFVAMPVL